MEVGMKPHRKRVPCERCVEDQSAAPNPVTCVHPSSRNLKTWNSFFCAIPQCQQNLPEKYGLWYEFSPSVELTTVWVTGGIPWIVIDSSVLW